MGKIDAAYRRLFQHKEVLHDLMACVLSPSLFQSLDWDRMRAVTTNHVSERLEQRTGDCAWLIPWAQVSPGTESVPCASGQRQGMPLSRHVFERQQRTPSSLCVLLLFEQQTQPDRTMALRIVAYAGLSYQTLLRDKLVRLPLPPVLPVVLYSGDRPWHSALSMAELLGDIPTDLVPYQPQMRYLLVHERALLEGAQLPDRNLAALLFRLAKSRDIEQWRNLLHTLMDVVRGPAHEELNRSLTAWLQYAARGDDSPANHLPSVKTLQELDMMIAEKPGIWVQHWKQEAQADQLLRQMQRRFGSIPEATEQRIRTASAEQLETWSLNFVDATTLEDVFRD